MGRIYFVNLFSILKIISPGRFAENKYIIFGIVDKTHTRKGIDKSLWRDDNEWQNYFIKISPRPEINTGMHSKLRFDKRTKNTQWGID